MLNAIWAFMIIIGIIYGAFTGHLSDISAAALDSATEAVSLCITMLGIMAFWVGLMKIAECSGMVTSITASLRPILRHLFPNLSPDSKAMEYISTNVVANILGLGWACTPAGLKAMEELSRLSPKKEVATNEMCNFLILNISSLQLIPVNIIVYRSRYGSVNPSGIIVPAILATSFSTLAGILFILIAQKRST